MQDLQPILGTGQVERNPQRKSWFQHLPLIAIFIAIAGGGCLFFEYAIKLRLTTYAAREDIADAKIRHWVPPNAKSIELRRRLHHPLLLIESRVTETDFRVWCERGAFELHELDPDELARLDSALRSRPRNVHPHAIWTLVSVPAGSKRVAE